MKKLVLLAAACLICSVAVAQSAREESVAYDKQNVQGVSILMPGFSEDVVKNALTQRMEKAAGLKGSNSKGWRVYLSQQFPEIGTMNFDIYTQVTVQGKKKDQSTVVYFLVSKGNENFVTSASDPEVINNVKRFLDGFATYVKEYETNQKILEQTNLLRKTQKEYEALVADRDKMKSQISDLEKKIMSKEKDITNKEAEVKKAEELLNTLKNSL